MIPNVDAVINLDEVAMSISAIMGTMRTVTTQSDQSVQVHADGQDTKRMATLIPIAGVRKKILLMSSRTVGTQIQNV